MAPAERSTIEMDKYNTIQYCWYNLLLSYLTYICVCVCVGVCVGLCTDVCVGVCVLCMFVCMYACIINNYKQFLLVRNERAKSCIHSFRIFL